MLLRFFGTCKLTIKVTISLISHAAALSSRISLRGVGGAEQGAHTQDYLDVRYARRPSRRKAREAPPLMCSFLSAFNCRPRGHACRCGITDTDFLLAVVATSCPSLHAIEILFFSVSFSGSCRLICFGLLTSLLMDHRVRPSVSPSSQLVAIVGENGRAMQCSEMLTITHDRKSRERL